MRKSKSCIKELRTKLGLSTTQMAHRLDVAQSTALRLEQAEERGAITLASLERAARALGAELEYRFILERTTRQRTDKRRTGMKRLSRYSKRRRSVNDYSREQQAARSRSMSPQERVREACELSDLGRRIQACSSKPS